MRKISRVAQRYSTAFFQVVKSSSLLDKVENDLVQLNHIISTNSDIAGALTNPLISRNELEKLLITLANGLEFQEVTTKFLRLLARKRRTNQLSQIIQLFISSLSEERNQLSVKIHSHSQLASSQLEGIEKVLHDKTGRKIMLDMSIDQSLLGGIVIQYGSYKLDFSLKSKLIELKHTLERLI